MERKIQVNAGDLEHIAAMGIGAVLLTLGVKRRGWGGAILAGAGLGMVGRGLQGYKRVFNAVGLPFEDKPVTLAKRALKIEKHIRIERSPEDLYAFWRKLSNLPSVMQHIVSVQENGRNRSHWVAKAPIGTIVEWDAEIINDVPNELIAWRSFEGSDVDNAGSVHFEPDGHGGTVLKLVIRYTPPADVWGARVAKLFGQDPAKEVEADLLAFKERIEAEGSIRPAGSEL